MRYAYIPESDAAHDAYDPYAIIREPFPAPLRSSRISISGVQVPTPVLSLVEFARENSWEVRTQYSQGCMPHATTGRPGVLKDLIGVRFGAHPMTPRQAYAVYSRNASGGGWAWSSVMIWGPDLPPYRGCGISELKAYLMMCPTTGTVALGMWVRDLKEIAANGEMLRKRREAARKDVKDMNMAGRTRGDIYEHVMTFYTVEEVDKIIAGMKTTDREGMR